MKPDERDELIRMAGSLSEDLAVLLRTLAETTADVARLAAGARHLMRLAGECTAEPETIELFDTSLPDFDGEPTTERTENTEREG